MSTDRPPDAINPFAPVFAGREAESALIDEALTRDRDLPRGDPGGRAGGHRQEQAALRGRRAGHDVRSLLLLDDVQWADEASVGLLEFLLCRPPAGLTGFVLCYRSGTCPPRVADALRPLGERLRQYADIPYTDGALTVLAKQVRRFLQAKTGVSGRVLALDLDNTLWGAVLGEVGGSEEYLAALDVTVTIAKASEFDVPRIAQMAARTNQYNLTGIRYSEPETAKLAEDPDHLVFS